MLHRNLFALLATCGLLSACGPSHHEPREVDARNPTVTYHYRGDQELMRANQQAVAYCAQYHAVPQSSKFYEGDEGHTVVFDCVPAPTDQRTTYNFAPETPYGYRDDRDLLEAARNAEIYCRNHGGRGAVSTVSVAPDGTKSTSFRCEGGY